MGRIFGKDAAATKGGGRLFSSTGKSRFKDLENTDLAAKRREEQRLRDFPDIQRNIEAGGMVSGPNTRTPSLGDKVFQGTNALVGAVTSPAKQALRLSGRAVESILGTGNEEGLQAANRSLEASQEGILRLLRDPKIPKARKDILLGALNETAREQVLQATQNTQQVESDTDIKKNLGAAAQIASLGFGGGSLVSAARAGNLGKAAAATTASGALGGAGYTLQEDEDAGIKDLIKSAAVGGAVGLALPTAGAAISKLRAGTQISHKEAAALVNFYRGGGSRVASTGDNMFGEGFYVTPNRKTASIFGDTSEIPVDMSKAKILEVKNATDYQRLVNEALRENPGVNAQQAIPLYARGKGYQAIRGAEEFDELAGMNILDQSLIPKTPTPQKVALTEANNQTVQLSQDLVNKTDSLLGTAEGIVTNQSRLADQIKVTYPHLEDSVQTLTHNVRNQKSLAAAADKMLADDLEGAREIFSSGSLAQIAPDAHIKLGEKLATQAAKQGDTATLNEVLASHQTALTSHAQALRAAGSTNILNPDAIVAYAARKADQSGRKLSPDLVRRLESESSKIAKMQDGPEKVLATVALKELAENPSALQKGGKFVNQTLASFRATLASTDLSGGGRQGGVAFSRFPKIGAQAEAAGVKAAFSPKAFVDEATKIANLTDVNGTPLSQAFKRMKLSLNILKGVSEEQFQNAALVEGKLAKRLGVGHIISGSNRAYDTTLSYMRAHIAKEIVDGAGGVDNLMQTWNSAQWRSLGRVIDTITGVGRGGKPIIGDKSLFESIAPALSKGLFSAKLWKSRLDLLNPLYYAEVANNPVAFKLAVRSGLQFATTVSAVLGAATALGATVETDLRSSDFGKIKVGNSRIDIMGGLQQNLVFFWRELMGESKSSSTGNISDLSNPAYGGATRLSIASNTVQNKLTPVLSEIIRQIRGTDIGGHRMTGEDRLKSLGSNFVPLAIQDIYSGIQEEGLRGGAVGALGFIGAGTSTYGPRNVNWDDSDSKTLTQFEQKVGPVKFKEANEKYNQEFNAWLERINNDKRYNALSVQDQAIVRSSKSEEIKDSLFKSYGFKYQRENTNRLKNF